MNVFEQYKPLRNKLSRLACDESLATVWAYSQYLQIDGFKFPPEIEVRKDFLELDVPQRWISEWSLELLAKELILNASLTAKEGTSLRKWKQLADTLNGFKALDEKIYKELASPQNIMVQLIRIAHQQFIWQGNPPNAASIIRYYRIFQEEIIDKICIEKFDLSVWQIFMCGVACMGNFLTHPSLKIPFKSEIAALPVESFERFFKFTARDRREFQKILKVNQSYDENFSYAYNALRASPLVGIDYAGVPALVCPVPTLLYWRFTSGLYYELVADVRFANAFGKSFEKYVGEVIERAIPIADRLGEVEYTVGKLLKRSIDWIVARKDEALFVECKSKRISLKAKVSLHDLDPLEADIDTMANAIVQVYKTIIEYQKGHYPHFPFSQERKIFPLIVSLENWHMMGPIMWEKLDEKLVAKFDKEKIDHGLLSEMPFSIWAIEELEVGLQLMNEESFVEFIGKKMKDAALRRWGWTGYMNHYYKDRKRRRLFDAEYDEMFTDLISQQDLQTRQVAIQAS